VPRSRGEAPSDMVMHMLLSAADDTPAPETSIDVRRFSSIDQESETPTSQPAGHGMIAAVGCERRPIWGLRLSFRIDLARGIRAGGKHSWDLWAKVHRQAA